MSIDGSCLFLLDQRDLCNQLGIKSSITIGIIMAWVEFGFKGYERYLQQHLCEKQSENGEKNLERIDQMVRNIKNIQLDIASNQLQKKFINKNQNQNLINLQYYKTFKLDMKSQQTEHFPIQIPSILNQKLQNISQTLQQHHSNQYIKHEQKKLQQISQHLIKNNINKIKILQIFDKSTNLCIQINKFPFNLITELDKINKDHKNFYHTPTNRNQKNYCPNEILKIKEDKEKEYDENGNEKRINKNYEKSNKRTLRDQIKYFVPLQSVQHENNSYDNLYLQQRYFPNDHHYPFSVNTTFNSFSKIYDRDILNTQIIITKQQKEDNDPYYYLSLIIKYPPNYITQNKINNQHLQHNLLNNMENIYNKMWNWKKYEENGVELEEENNNCSSEQFLNRDYNYFGDMYRNNQSQLQNWKQESERQQQSCYEDKQYQQVTNGNQCPNIYKSKSSKPKKHVKTFNRYSISHHEFLSFTTPLNNQSCNKDISIYILIKQAILIPQNQYNSLDIYTYQNKKNKQNSNVKNTSQILNFYNKYKFMVDNYEFIPEFYVQKLSNQEDDKSSFYHYGKKQNDEDHLVVMILSTMNDKIKLQLLPQYRSINKINNQGYHENNSSTNQHFSTFFICVDPFTKFPILQQPQPEQTLSSYLCQCRYQKLAAVLYVSQEKQYYLCNVNDLQGFVHKKTKEINRKYRQNRNNQEQLWMGQKEEQAYRKLKKIGKNKGNARTFKQSFQTIDNSSKTPVFRYKPNLKQHNPTLSSTKPNNTPNEPPIKIWSKLPIELIERPKPKIKEDNKNIDNWRKSQQMLEIAKLLKNKTKIRHNYELKIGTREIVFNIHVKNIENQYRSNYQQQNSINQHVNNIIEYNQLCNLDITNNNKYHRNITSNQYHSHLLSSPFNNKCILCCLRPNNCIYLQCKHNVTCVSCGKMLDHCPICRQPISDYVRIYST